MEERKNNNDWYLPDVPEETAAAEEEVLDIFEDAGLYRLPARP